jgi:hypothetical protein
MEIVGFFGIIILLLIVFAFGGVLGWIMKGIGSIFELLFEGWGSCLRIIVWIILIIIALMVMAL